MLFLMMWGQGHTVSAKIKVLRVIYSTEYTVIYTTQSYELYSVYTNSLKHLHLILLQPALHDWQAIISRMALGIGSLVINKVYSLPSFADRGQLQWTLEVGTFGRVILAHCHILD